MRNALSNVLGARDEDRGTDRILAAAFFRKRPLQAGSSPAVIFLADRQRPRGLTTATASLEGERR